MYVIDEMPQLLDVLARLADLLPAEDRAPLASYLTAAPHTPPTDMSDALGTAAYDLDTLAYLTGPEQD